MDEKVLPVLVWLEESKRGVFVPHTIEMGFARHAALDVGDINGDGAADIGVGNFSLGSRSGVVDVRMNRGKKQHQSHG